MYHHLTPIALIRCRTHCSLNNFFVVIQIKTVFKLEKIIFGTIEYNNTVEPLFKDILPIKEFSGS